MQHPFMPFRTRQLPNCYGCQGTTILRTLLRCPAASMFARHVLHPSQTPLGAGWGHRIDVFISWHVTGMGCYGFDKSELPSWINITSLIVSSQTMLSGLLFPYRNAPLSPFPSSTSRFCMAGSKRLPEGSAASICVYLYQFHYNQGLTRHNQPR